MVLQAMPEFQDEDVAYVQEFRGMDVQGYSRCWVLCWAMERLLVLVLLVTVASAAEKWAYRYDDHYAALAGE